MKRILFILGLAILTIESGCQGIRQTFDEVVLFKKGFKIGTDANIQTVPYLGSTGTMIYPSVGIPVSMGTSWGASIINNSTNWNTAYSWGNHAGLYKPVNWFPKWSEILEKPAQRELKDAIPMLDYLPIPHKTTTQINALVLTEAGIVYDENLQCYKLYIYQSNKWVIIPTGQ